MQLWATLPKNSLQALQALFFDKGSKCSDHSTPIVWTSLIQSQPGDLIRRLHLLQPKRAGSGLQR